VWKELLLMFGASHQTIPVEFTQKTIPEGISQKPSDLLWKRASMRSARTRFVFCIFTDLTDLCHSKTH
jgi:hypothetical protein